VKDKDSKLIWEAHERDPFDRYTEATPHNSTEWRKIRDLVNKSKPVAVKFETSEGHIWLDVRGFGQGPGNGWPSKPGDDDLSLYGYLKGGDATGVNINVSDSRLKIVDIIT